MTNYLSQYFRYPDDWLAAATRGGLSAAEGFFRFGEDAVCYGRCAGEVSSSPAAIAFDAANQTEFNNDVMTLPFDLREVVDNLREERYVKATTTNHNSARNTGIAGLYYLLRPLLPIEVRKHLQKIRLNGWNRLTFPRWPVDTSVDNLFKGLLSHALHASANESVPFIWFWPDGAPSCAIMTHDVEGNPGKDFCSSLMDINESFGIKASFQIVPERRYEVTPAFLKSIRDRGFSVNIQDLNHDGRLFNSHREFLARAAKINEYSKQYGAEGFRSAILYRVQQWLGELNFSYDMSVPNVAHLDPQRGGCCTVMPYFIGNLLELPVTMTQDYSLFHILNDYSINLWKQQTELVMARHGLMSFIVHPDYIIPERARKTYKELLGYLSHLRDEKAVWMPSPGEVNQWWRQRAKMSLVNEKGQWRIVGEGHQRAKIAYASNRDGGLEFTFDPQTAQAGRAVRAK